MDVQMYEVFSQAFILVLLINLDRMIRLRKARVLLVGMSSLGNEVCKNILLAGIKHLTILDDKTLNEKDFEQQFFSGQEDVGKNRAEASLARSNDLNPMVDIVADKQNVKEKNEEFYKNFDVVCICDCPVEIQIKVNEICHRLGIKFLCGRVFGYYGYMFQDLGHHKYMEEVVKKAKVKKDNDGPSEQKKQKVEQAETEYEEKVSDFCTLGQALKVSVFENIKSERQAKQVSKTYLIMKVLIEYEKRYGEIPQSIESNSKLQQLIDVRSEVFDEMSIDGEFLPDDFSSFCVGQLFPVCPIVGGVMSQEIIKAVSGKDAPHNNFFFYDGVSTSGVVQKITNITSPKKEDQKMTSLTSKQSVEEIVL